MVVVERCLLWASHLPALGFWPPGVLSLNGREVEPWMLGPVFGLSGLSSPTLQSTPLFCSSYPVQSQLDLLPGVGVCT